MNDINGLYERSIQYVFRRINFIRFVFAPGLWGKSLFFPIVGNKLATFAERNNLKVGILLSTTLNIGIEF